MPPSVCACCVPAARGADCSPCPAPPERVSQPVTGTDVSCGGCGAVIRCVLAHARGGLGSVTAACPRSADQPGRSFPTLSEGLTSLSGSGCVTSCKSFFFFPREKSQSEILVDLKKLFFGGGVNDVVKCLLIYTLVKITYINSLFRREPLLPAHSWWVRHLQCPRPPSLGRSRLRALFRARVRFWTVRGGAFRVLVRGRPWRRLPRCRHGDPTALPPLVRRRPFRLQAHEISCGGRGRGETVGL